MTLSGYRLGDFALMMREKQIHSPAMYIKSLTQIFGSHRGTFEMPTGKTVAPRRRPTHDMLGRRFFPQCKVERIPFLGLTVERTSRTQQFFDITTRKFSVVMIFVVLLHIKVNRPFAHIGIAVFENLFYILDLFDDMPRSMRLDTGRQHIERLHRFVVAVEIKLYHLHRFELFETGFFRDLILSLIGIVFEMSHIGDIAHIAYLITDVFQVTEKQIKCNGRAGMTQMGIAIYRRTAHIHSRIGRIDRYEFLFTPIQCIINEKFLFHNFIFWKYKCSNSL